MKEDVAYQLKIVHVIASFIFDNSNFAHGKHPVCLDKSA